MNQVVGYAAMLLVLIAVAGGDASFLQRGFALLLLCYAGFHVMIRRQLPRGFWTHLVLLLVAPAVVLWIVAAARAQWRLNFQ